MTAAQCADSAEGCRCVRITHESSPWSYSHATFTNASQASTWFAINTLTPWARKLEAEFSRSVFTDPAFHLEVDLSGLVRGDYATRWTANVAAVTAGILTADEIRGQEGFGPRPTAESVPPA